MTSREVEFACRFSRSTHLIASVASEVGPQRIMEADGSCSLRDPAVQGSAKGHLNPALAFSEITSSYFPGGRVSRMSQNSSIHPPPRQSPSRGKPSCWTRSPAPTTPAVDKRGPLLRCQDNATAAIVKSQGYCVVDFSAGLQGPAHYSRHAETHSGTNTHKDDREM